MESGYPGVRCSSHSEYWDIDPVWAETDEGGEDCPFHDLGKGIVGLTSRRTLSRLRRPATVGDVTPWAYLSAGNIGPHGRKTGFGQQAVDR